jgi:hypothetical protein
LIAAAVIAFGAPQAAHALEGEEEDPLIGVPEVRSDAHRDRVPDPHDPTRSLHPYRIAAYALHPVGVILDWVIVRPAVWVGRQEPFRTLFGYEED